MGATTNTKVRSTPKWAEMRHPDGNPITISFSVYDDHSAWRIDELGDQLAKAETLLQSAGERYIKPTSTYELEQLVEKLADLCPEYECEHDECETTSLATEIREIVIGADDDAQFEYEYSIEAAEELIDAWDAQFTWRYTEDEWDITAWRLFQELRNNRNGLGERWKVIVCDEWVELPDGSCVYGVTMNPKQENLLDDLVANDPYEHHAESSKIILALDAEAVERALTISETLSLRYREFSNGKWTEKANPVVLTVCRIANVVPDEGLDEYLEIAEGLLSNWSGSMPDALCAAEHLLHENHRTR